MEYELLKFFVTHPGKVFTREQLLSRVWGYEYYGGARTVDVHVRRLRAKLGEEHANLIQTVRSVGYRFGQSRWPGSDAGCVGGTFVGRASASPTSDSRRSPTSAPTTNRPIGPTTKITNRIRTAPTVMNAQQPSEATVKGRSARRCRRITGT